MSIHDDDRPEDDGVYQSAAGRGRGRRRKRIAVGVIGLAAVLGAGSYVVAAQIINGGRGTVTGDTGALTPMVTPWVEPSTEQTAAPSASVRSTTTTRSAVKRSASPPPSLPPSLSAEEEVRRAREQAERDGSPVRPGLTAAGRELGTVAQYDKKLPHGTLRVITAKWNLNGHREQLWAADEGKPVGNARCTQNLHFSNSAKPFVQPNLLLCWRTSDTRSVITVLTDTGGKPSARMSADVIDQEWAKLG